MAGTDWDSIGDSVLQKRAVGNLTNGAAVAPQVAADAVNAAPASGVPAATAMHAPTEPNDMALFHNQTAILNSSPPVRSFAASDPAVATATKDDWSNLAGVAAALQRFSVTRNASAPGLAALNAASLDFQRQKAAYAAGNFMGGIKAGGSRVEDALGVLLSPAAGLANVFIDPAAGAAAKVAPYASGAFRTGILTDPIAKTSPEIAKGYYKSLFGDLLMFAGGPKGSAFDRIGMSGAAEAGGAEAAAAAPKPPGSGPPSANPDGGFHTNAEGHVVDNTGAPATFNTAKEAAVWIQKEGYATPHSQIFEPANGPEGGYVVKQTGTASGPDTAPGINPAVDELHTEAAKTDAKEVADLQEQVASTATHGRSPDLMQDFLHNHAGASAEVAVDSAALVKLYSEGTPLFKDKFTDIQAAVQSGSFVKIPLSQYLTETAGQPFADELNAATRFRDNGVSVNEAADLPKPSEEPEFVEQGAALRFDMGETVLPASEGSGTAFLVKPNTREPERMQSMLPVAEEFGGRFAPGRANTAFTFKTPAAREQFLEAMKAHREAELAPMAEDIKGKPGVNVRRMAGMLGPQLYGDPTVTAEVTAKEVLQNSFDAIKNAMTAVPGLKGKIDIHFDRDDRKIVFHDNGSGMAPDLLSGKFLQIAGSEKGANASGGFGIAKMLFLYGNQDLHVTTMKDGVVSEMKTSGPELMNALDEEGGGPNIQVRRGDDITAADRELFPDGHGTHISLQIPKTYTDQKTGQEEPIPFPYDATDVPALVHSPLFADIDVNFRDKYGEVTPVEGVGSKFPAKDFTTFANVKFPWGTARIYISKEPVKGAWNPMTHILSNGLWQFSEKLPADPKDMYGKQLPFKIYVDVNPNVKPDQPGYPFGFNRQAFTETAKKDMDQIKKYIQATYGAKVLAEGAQDFGEVKYLGITGGYSPSQTITPELPQTPNAFDKLKEGSDVEVRDGKLIVNGEEMPDLTPEELQAAIPKADELRISQDRIDAHRVMIHDNTKLPGVETADNPFPDETNISSVMQKEFGPRWVEFERTVGQAFLELRDNVAAIMGYDALATEAVGLSYDKTYHGVSIKVPFNGMFLNPLTSESVVPAEQAYGMVGTMIHELAHFKVRSHNADFPAEMQRIAVKLAADAHGKVGFDFFEFQQRFVTDVLQFSDIIAKGKEYFDGSDISNANSGFGSGTFSGADAGSEGDAQELGAARQATGSGSDIPDAAGQGGEAGGSGADAAGPGGPSSGDAIGTFVGDVQRTATAAVRAAKQVETELGLTKIFEDAKALGLTKGQFRAYSRALTAWEKEVEEKTVRKMVQQFHKEHTPDWKAAIELQTEDAIKNINAQTSVRAMRALRDPMFKLDRDEVEEKFPGLNLPDTIMKRGGMTLEEAAELNDFTTGSAMVQALAGLQTAITNSGSPSLDAYIKMRAKVFATEQARQMTGYDMSPEAILADAREAADSPTLEDALVGSVKDFAETNGLPFNKDAVKTLSAQEFGAMRAGDAAKPKTFAENMRRIGNQAEKHLLAGKPMEALRAKVQQLMQYQHMRAAFAFQKEFASANKRMGQIARKPIMAGMDQTARNQLRAIVRDVGFTVRTGQYEDVDAALKGQTLRNYVDSMRARGLEPVMADIPKADLKDLTVEQFRGVDETVKSIAQLGRDEKKAYNNRKAAELTDIGQEVKENASKIGRPFTAGELHRLEGSVKGAVGGGSRSLGAAVSRPETFLYWLDGEKIGPMMKYLVAELQDGKYYKTDKIQKIGERFRDFVKNQPKGWQHSLEDAVDAPELTYSRGADGQPTPWLRNRGEVIMMATHFGSESNLSKLLDGFGWDEDTARSVADRILTEADWQYVQHILDINKMLLPDVKALYRTTVGLAMKDIPAIPIKTPYGELPGGYRHITYDWNAMEERVPESPEEEAVSLQNDPTALHASDLFGNQYRTATPPNGYTLSRTKFAAPFNLDHGILHREFESVVHDLAYRKGLIQATKILRVPAVRQGVREALGPEYLNTINSWLRDIARGSQYDQTVLKGAAALIRGIRRRFTLVQIGYNVATLLKHGGIAAAHIGGEVGIPEFAKASADLMNDADLLRWVTDNSGEVRGALMNLDRDVREIMQDLFRKQGFVDNYRYHAFTMFGKVKQIEATATWLAKYRTLTEKENVSHDDAVQLANKSVRDTQGAGGPVDLPQLWRGGTDFWGEVGKLSNIFTGFENTATNRAWTMIRRGGRGGGGGGPPGTPGFNPGKGWDDRGPAGQRRDFGKNFTDLLAYFVIPALYATAFDTVTQGKLKKGAKNGAVFLEHYLENTLKGALGGTIPMGNLLAELPRAIQTRGKDWGSDGPIKEMFGATVGTSVNAWDAAHGHKGQHKVEDRWVQHAMETAGYIFNLPTKPAAKGGQFLWDKSQGHVKDKGLIEFFRGLVFGPTSEEAKKPR